MLGKRTERADGSTRGVAGIAALATTLVCVGSMARPQEPLQPAAGPAMAATLPPAPALPFHVGERLTYRVRGSKLGAGGRASMTVSGPADIRGTPTYVLTSRVEMRVGLVKAVNRTQSWLDPRRLASLRFRKHERSLISRQDEAFELYPESGRWEGKDGTAGALASDAPLDELSFIYFLRTLPLERDSTYRFDRYFDPARNPTTVEVVGRETITTGAGRFPTVVVEMRVKDPARYRGEGVIRINFTDDGCRLPVRIESSAPVVGAAVMTLESYTHDRLHLATPDR